MKHNQINLFLFILFALGLGACSKTLDSTTDESELAKNEKSIQDYLTKNSLSATKDSSGLYYVKQVNNPQGAKAKVGDEVAIYYKIYTLDGVVVDSTETAAKNPLRFTFGTNYHLPGVERAISLMREGEKMTLLLPFYLAFGNVGYDKIPAYSPIRVELELVQVRTEAQQIEDYIMGKKYTVSETTSSGVRIIRQNTVTGDMIGNGKTVSVKYVGKLLSGKEFDKGTLSATPGSRGLIPGFEEGVSRLRKGEKAILIFPSSQGYGTKGVGANIGPYTPLIFEIEVLE
ncbi:FKBP-type peptidyl-prolyl cis-trans isomerase [Persicitalea sp.]|uniref:FKBP-type peptidyl-prolyl cis-trans isomerase n=1 Tax=Persicitalea sp. TaxID=3100273 RepID=UPI003594867C